MVTKLKKSNPSQWSTRFPRRFLDFVGGGSYASSDGVQVMKTKMVCATDAQHSITSETGTVLPYL